MFEWIPLSAHLSLSESPHLHAMGLTSPIYMCKVPGSLFCSLPVWSMDKRNELLITQSNYCSLNNLQSVSILFLSSLTKRRPFHFSQDTMFTSWASWCMPKSTLSIPDFYCWKNYKQQKSSLWSICKPQYRYTRIHADYKSLRWKNL